MDYKVPECSNGLMRRMNVHKSRADDTSQGEEVCIKIRAPFAPSPFRD
jgi:hypothetical protein